MVVETDGIGHLGALESYLMEARIISIEKLVDDGSYHKGKMRVLLEGGVVAIAKPEDGCDEGHWLIRCEAGAWILAKGLGWTHLVPCTVLRKMMTMSSVDGLCSFQVALHSVEPDLWDDTFDRGEIQRAAALDYIFGQTDRRSRNWLKTKPAFGTSRFLLHDNGFAGLRSDTKGFSSRFFKEVDGEDIPDGIITKIERFLQDQALQDRLAQVLPDHMLDGMLERARHLVTERKFVVDVTVTART